MNKIFLEFLMEFRFNLTHNCLALGNFAAPYARHFESKAQKKKFFFNLGEG